MSGLFQCRAVKTGLLEGFQVGLKRVLAQGGGKRSQLNKKRKESTELFGKMNFFFTLYKNKDKVMSVLHFAFKPLLFKNRKLKNVSNPSLQLTRSMYPRHY